MAEQNMQGNQLQGDTGDENPGAHLAQDISRDELKGGETAEAAETSETAEAAEAAPEKRGYLLGEILESVAIAVVLAVIIRLFIFQNYSIPTGSMEPTLNVGDYIGVNKIIYKISQPHRGDIMVFKYPLNPKRVFVKRVIGLPGETVQLRDSVLYIDGKVVAQPYLPKNLRFGDYGPVTVTNGQYFVLGDNRNNSDDSRVWGFVPGENVIGKAIFIYWPLNRMRIVH